MGKTCSEYRAAARRALKGKYWYAFGICMLVTIINELTTGVVELADKISEMNLYGSAIVVDTYGPGSITEGGHTMAGFILLVMLSLFVTFPLVVGTTRYFILNTKGRADVKELAYPYKNNLMNIIAAQVKKLVFTVLWTMLFIIPGIVKGYSYYMVDYIMAENPYITSRRAFEISKQAMDGYKMKAFLLELSFIGWILLYMLIAGIAVSLLTSYVKFILIDFSLVFLAVYMRAALAELYLDIKASAFERGIIIDGELPR